MITEIAPATRNDAADVAALILKNFRAYRHGFRAITLAAKTRFESAAWLDGQHASAERIEIYKEFVGALQDDIRDRLGGLPLSPTLSRAVKAEYVKLISTQPDFELAETYYNSIHRRIAQDDRVDETQSFVWSEFHEPPVTPARADLPNLPDAPRRGGDDHADPARSRFRFAVAGHRSRRAQHPPLVGGSAARDPPPGRTRRRDSRIDLLSQQRRLSGRLAAIRRGCMAGGAADSRRRRPHTLRRYADLRRRRTVGGVQLHALVLHGRRAVSVCARRLSERAAARQKALRDCTRQSACTNTARPSSIVASSRISRAARTSS